MQRTKIEYLDYTYNPIAMRCTRVSDGCKNCWHLRMAHRHAANPKLTPEMRGARAGGAPVLLEDELAAPLRLRKPAVIGVQFMGDLFHESVPTGWIDEVLNAMALAPQHTYMILTKRPERMRAEIGGSGEIPWLWLGVSIEDQPTADERIPLLLATPAARRAVSYEPALGPIDLDADWLMPRCNGCRCHMPRWQECPHDCRMAPLDTPHLSWVIAGAETGPGKRPAELGWFRSVRDQCKAAGVPFFMKKTSDGDPPEDLMIHELQWSDRTRDVDPYDLCPGGIDA